MKIIGWLLFLAWTLAATGSEARRSLVLSQLEASGEKYWKSVMAEPPSDQLSSRDLFSYALLWCELRKHPERLERLFDLGARLQDREAQSRSYGNFRWNWGAPAVLDYNAVDFCMQGASVIWLKHRDFLTAPARARLQEILRHAVPASLRHKVNENYTNIALMNAANLIVLGEALGLPEASAAGRQRLEAVIRYTLKYGTHEYCSPTYYGVDLEVLGVLETLAPDERTRQQARALLELFWTDIAANWFPASGKIAGTRSRDYDYLRGLGMLDWHTWLAGWIAEEQKFGPSAVFMAIGRWQPPAALRELAFSGGIRLVRQSWGARENEFRTHLLQPDITLSVSGAGYGTMDLPLTLDLPGPRQNPRGYFLADGRHDPYGKLKIPERSGHQKTLHLTPFLAGAQDGPDALLLAVYRDKDIPTNSTTLESHLVLPKTADGYWVNERPVVFSERAPLLQPLRPGEALILRQKTAAAAIRIPWARNCSGGPAAVALHWDTNRFGVARITADHQLSSGKLSKAQYPGAAFWIRVASGLENDAAFERWRAQVLKASPRVEATATRLRVETTGAQGLLSVAADAPFTGQPTLQPPPAKVVLEINGEDVGRKILERLPLAPTGNRQ